MIATKTIEHAVDPALITELEQGMAQLFGSPLQHAEFRRPASGAVHAGYTPPSVEGVRGYAPDPNRHFWDIDATEEFLPLELAVLARRLHDRLAETAFSALRDIGEPWAEQATQDIQGGNHLLRIVEYLNERADEALLMPAHVDWGVVTLFVGGSLSGLQGFIAGEWRDLEIPAGAVLVAPGTLAAMYAAKKISALRHRVLAKSVGRIAFTFFLEVREDVLLPNGETARERYRRIESSIRRET